MNAATINAVNPTQSSFEQGGSFSDGDKVVGVDDDSVVIAWNNTIHNQHQINILTMTDAISLYALLHSALKKVGKVI